VTAEEQNRDFRGITVQTKEEKTTWELKDIYFSSTQTVMERLSDIWQQRDAK
jgi:hypothetical protein